MEVMALYCTFKSILAQKDGSTVTILFYNRNIITVCHAWAMLFPHLSKFGCEESHTRWIYNQRGSHVYSTDHCNSSLPWFEWTCHAGCHTSVTSALVVVHVTSENQSLCVVQWLSTLTCNQTHILSIMAVLFCINLNAYSSFTFGKMKQSIMKELW